MQCGIETFFYSGVLSHGRIVLLLLPLLVIQLSLHLCVLQLYVLIKAARDYEKNHEYQQTLILITFNFLSL